MRRGIDRCCGTLWLATLAFLLGCRIDHRPLDAAYAGPRPLPPAIAERYTPPPGELKETPWPPEPGRDYERTRYCLESDPLPPFDVDFFRTRHGEGRRPVVIVVPILHGRYILEEAVAELLTADGISVAVLLRDRPALEGKDGGRELERKALVATVQARRAVDWLATREDVDPERIGALGMSLGGIRLACVLAVEPRIACAVLGLAGADVPDILAESDEPLVSQWRWRRLWDQGLSRDVFVDDLKAHIRTDPLYLAPYIDAGRVLMFVTQRDDTVPTRNQELLYRLMGRPECHFVPAGHYGSLRFADEARDSVRRFFRERLNP